MSLTPRTLLRASRFSAVLFVALCIVMMTGVLHAQTAPVITTQPRTQTVNVGTAVTFTVVATGASLTYQWTFGGTAISGATTATYVISSAIASNAGNYAVVVASGTATTTSANGTLLIYTPYVVKTLAGTATVTGSTDGAGASARFFAPQGIAVDGSGNMYVSDSANDVIRKITPAGVVSTLAGTAGVSGTADGTGPAAQFFDPTGLAVDSSGNVYVTDTFNSTIRKITPAGVVTTFAGLAPTTANPDPMNRGTTNGTGGAARFNAPRGITIDGSGNLYVADTLNNLIRKITPAGVVTSLAGNSGAAGQSVDGTGTTANFDYPFGIASDSAGNLYVADTSGQTVRTVSPTGVVKTYAGLAGNGGSSGGTGNVARFSNPAGIAIDSQGNLYIADSNNSTIRQITPGGVVATLSGLAGNTGSVDASGNAARLFNPYAIAVDGAGNLYIADTFNATVRTAAPQSPTQFAPLIQTQPTSQSIVAGGTATFTVVASGNPIPTYQWQLGGVNVAGATSSTLAITNATTAQAGSYTLIATNLVGSATSNAVTLAVTAPPVFTSQPPDQSVSAGAVVTLSPTITGATSYQWKLNGTAITGATGTTLVLNGIGTNQAGAYTLTGTNIAGSVTSPPINVAVAWDARLINLSARANVGVGNNNLIAGFIASGTGSKKVVLRAIGPGLTQFNVSGVLANPLLTLIGSNQAAISTNTSWGGTAALMQLFTQVGAFPISPTSTDAAIAPTLAAGGYTVQVSGVGNTSGVALAEIYDADTGTPTARLINISARANVGVGSNVLVAGFIIAGTTSETVLLRGAGPALAAAPFSLTGTLAKPVLTLQDSTGKLLGTNAAWGGGTALSSAFALVGAFSFAPTSSDDAILITLPPGGYTATLSGAGNTSGIALVEVYEVP